MVPVIFLGGWLHSGYTPKNPKELNFQVLPRSPKIILCISICALRRFTLDTWPSSCWPSCPIYIEMDVNDRFKVRLVERGKHERKHPIFRLGLCRYRWGACLRGCHGAADVRRAGSHVGLNHWAGMRWAGSDVSLSSVALSLLLLPSVLGTATSSFEPWKQENNSRSNNNNNNNNRNNNNNNNSRSNNNNNNSRSNNNNNNNQQASTKSKLNTRSRLAKQHYVLDEKACPFQYPRTWMFRPFLGSGCVPYEKITGQFCLRWLDRNSPPLATGPYSQLLEDKNLGLGGNRRDGIFPEPPKNPTWKAVCAVFLRQLCARSPGYF